MIILGSSGVCKELEARVQLFLKRCIQGKKKKNIAKSIHESIYRHTPIETFCQIWKRHTVVFTIISFYFYILHFHFNICLTTLPTINKQQIRSLRQKS